MFLQAQHEEQVRELKARTDARKIGRLCQQLASCKRQFQDVKMTTEKELLTLEKEVLGTSVADVWTETEHFFQRRAPGELVRAAQDPKHRMALVFRWYLGRSSAWAITGDTGRTQDYQIWCGPAMGAFNAWVRGSFLAEPADRGVVQIARNLLEGAAQVTRAQQLRSYGVPVPAGAFHFEPRPLA